MKILILGGGISGLSAAWYLRKKYPEAQISLLEKRARLGGVIETKKDFLFESGPRIFPYEKSPCLLKLIEELGLKDEMIFSKKASGRRLILHKNKLRSIPSLFPIIVPALIREYFLPSKIKEDESIYDFAKRRFGIKMAEIFFDPLALGIYAGDIHKLSLRSCFPFLYELEKKYGSILKGMLLKKRSKENKRFFLLKKGMESLIEALHKQLSLDIHFNSEIESISKEGVVAGGKFWEADWIISALPGPEIGRLTKGWLDFPAASLWVVHAAFPEGIFTKKGTSYLVPTKEGEELLGVIWDSSIFPQQERHTRFTAFLRDGGDAARAKKLTLSSLRQHLGIIAEPLFLEAQHVKGAIPQFEVGYCERFARFQAFLNKEFPTLSIVGNYVDGSSVNYCIRTAQRLAETPPPI